MFTDIIKVGGGVFKATSVGQERLQSEERAELGIEGVRNYLLSTKHQAEPRQGSRVSPE